MEEYRFEKVVNADYKDQFYNELSGLRMKGMKPFREERASMVDESKVKNKKIFFSTNYGMSYGKASFSDL